MWLCVRKIIFFFISVLTFALISIFIGISFKLALDFEHIPNIVSSAAVKEKYFDYIVIGSGTAGQFKVLINLKSSNKSYVAIK